jgi:hypothetical protein
MPTTVAKSAAAISAFLLFIMFIAGMSKVLRTKESPLLIRNGANALANLFRGVFK